MECIEINCCRFLQPGALVVPQTERYTSLRVPKITVARYNCWYFVTCVANEGEGEDEEENKVKEGKEKKWSEKI